MNLLNGWDWAWWTITGAAVLVAVLGALFVWARTRHPHGGHARPRPVRDPAQLTPTAYLAGVRVGQNGGGTFLAPPPVPDPDDPDTWFDPAKDAPFSITTETRLIPDCPPGHSCTGAPTSWAPDGPCPRCGGHGADGPDGVRVTCPDCGATPGGAAPTAFLAAPAGGLDETDAAAEWTTEELRAMRAAPYLEDLPVHTHPVTGPADDWGTVIDCPGCDTTTASRQFWEELDELDPIHPAQERLADTGDFLIWTTPEQIEQWGADRRDQHADATIEILTWFPAGWLETMNQLTAEVVA